MKRLSFSLLAVVALLGVMPAANAQLEGSVSSMEPGTTFWVNSPIGSEDRGQFIRYVTDDRLHADNINLRNRDFLTPSVAAMNGSGRSVMSNKTHGLAAKKMTAVKPIYVTGPWF